MLIIKVFFMQLLATTAILASSLDCPRGYLPVEGNPSLGTSPFCVMKFEAQNFWSLPLSGYGHRPWTNINAHDAAKTCKRLGRRYSLISNAQWMTVAEEIKNNHHNWTSGIVGNGSINRGNSDNTQAHEPSVPEMFGEFYGTTGSSTRPYCKNRFVCQQGREQKRTHRLKNNDLIYDFSGNVWEWVNWTTNSRDYTTPADLNVTPNGCLYDRSPIYRPGCRWITSRDIAPQDIIIQYNDGAGSFFGDYLGGHMSAVGQIEAQARGGDYSSGENSGIYAFMFISNTESRLIGFRCVWQ
jgi:hypothetical protein